MIRESTNVQTDSDGMPEGNDSDGMNVNEQHAACMQMEDDTATDNSSCIVVNEPQDATTQTDPYGPPPVDFPTCIFYVDKDGSGSMPQIWLWLLDIAWEQHRAHATAYEKQAH